MRTPVNRLAAAAAAAALVVALAIVVSRSAGEPPAPATGSSSVFAGIPQDGITLGDPGAPVTLVEYADLQCPYCAAYATGVLPTVVDRYVRTGKVKLELRPLAFLGQDSVEAARAVAATAQQDRMWELTERLFARQGAENSGWVTDGLLRDALESIPGVDAERALAGADSPAAARLLDRAERSARAAGVDGTPAFLIRRGDAPARPLPVGELAPEAFAAALDTALAVR